ncbi:hypothetical protein ABZV24_05200 [Streptomyces sp. NPDC005251]|uniref:hypothetical protein n=1 Tax=Streptomyces sp. NPDC005251 TaxID=3157166 RepID=UPI0033AA8EF7
MSAPFNKVLGATTAREEVSIRQRLHPGTFERSQVSGSSAQHVTHRLVSGDGWSPTPPLVDHERGALLPCRMDMTFSVYNYLNREKDA